LQHLYEQGIETCLIDNESTDNTVEIAKTFKNKGLFRIEKQPYPGYFDLVAQLQLKEKLVQEIDADWFIHYDADEIKEAPTPYKTLKEGIADADRQGYNAINFDEFVFLPTSENDNFEHTDYVKEMKYYYFFEPAPMRRINAWAKTTEPIDIISSGGHRINFEGIKIFPENFILRHYIALSKEHIIRKYYSERIFSTEEITKRGWHGPRATFTPDKLTLPDKSILKEVKNNVLDKSDIWTNHSFMEGNYITIDEATI
jgi:glycosyltransferase involved in cell wall biosynthesis